MAKKITREDRAKPATNAEATTDHVCTVMGERWRDKSIEQLLTQPLMAIEMSVEVCLRSGTLGKTQVGHILDLVEAIRRVNTDAEGCVHDVCRIALNKRKRGDLKKDRY